MQQSSELVCPKSKMQQVATRHRSYIAIALLSLLLLPTVADAQDVTGPPLKAAFIYNLAKFVEWPEDAPAAKPFTMCVLGDAAVGDALERSVFNRRLGGNNVSVLRLTASGPQRPCHILYMSGVTRDQAGVLVSALKTAPVLTISDIEGFTEFGGMVQFLYEHGQLRFRIGHEAAKRSGLQISAKLLSLAIRKND
jgi:hypothetical protein